MGLRCRVGFEVRAKVQSEFEPRFGVCIGGWVRTGVKGKTGSGSATVGCEGQV